jgi:DNA polymerase-3 subunit alpha
MYFAPAPGAGAETRERAAIRFGLAAIKGVGEVAVQSILKARGEDRRFQTLADMCERVDGRSLNRKMLEALVKAGACDAFGKTRATLMAQIERTLARAASLNADRQRGQSSLFGALDERSLARREEQANLPEWPEHEMLAHEKELLGFYVTGHPLTPYAPLLQKYSLVNTKMLATLPTRSLTRIGGMFSDVTRAESKKTGKKYALATLEDLEGSVQVLFINEAYAKFGELLEPKKAVLIVGEVNTGDEAPKIFPQELMPLDDAPRRYTLQVHLRFHTTHLDAAAIQSLFDLLEPYRGACPLFLCFKLPGGEMVFIEAHERYRVRPSRELQQAVDGKFGADTYYGKVDTSLPERAPRRWERRSENGEGE